MTNRFEVITSTLFFAQMRIEGSVTCSSSQIFAFSVWNVLTVGSPIEFSEAEINYIDKVLSLIVSSNQEIIRLNVSMDYPFLVDFLDTLDHLGCANADSFQIELMFAPFEQGF